MSRNSIIRVIVIIAFIYVGMKLALTIPGFSDTKEYPYSPDLKENKNIYMDVKALQVELYSTDGRDLFCNCSLTDGTEVWLHIPFVNYKEFDGSGKVVTPEGDVTYNDLTFDKPIKVHGKIGKTSEYREKFTWFDRFWNEYNKPIIVDYISHD